jgi:hypothetical protein
MYSIYSPCRATIYSSVWLEKRSVRPFECQTLSWTLYLGPGSRNEEN